MGRKHKKNMKVATSQPLPSKPPRWRRWAVTVAVCACLAGAGIVGLALANGNQSAPIYRAKVVQAYPHDAGAFTQGLLFDEGKLLEGTGLYGESSLRRVDLKTGKVEQQQPLDRRMFGEGIAGGG